MKVFHPSVYILLCLFSVTILFSQNNGKNNSNNSSTKRNSIGAIIGGEDNICAGSQTQFSVANLSNHAGHSGNWSVSNKLIATVNNNGLVTALRAGIFILKYDSGDSNCKGDSYRTIIVNSIPNATITGSNAICINGTTTLFPIIGGTWSSSNTQVATVNNFGIVKGIAAGSATFTFTNLAGCSSAATSSIVVNAVGNASITGESTICINETTTLSPSTGGTWTSSNKAVATVSNTGVVTGISPGSTTFTFTKTGSCASSPTPAVKVNAKTAVSITGKNVICKNATTALSPTSGGTWSSSNVNVATVTNNGVVTGVAVGKATFTFTKTDGCPSAPTAYITINDCPVAAITGPASICINGTTTLSPTTGGTWISSNTAVATVTNTGIVKGIAAGSVTFTYTKTGSCSSVPTPIVTVSAISPVRITGASAICINGTTTLSPSTGGTWSSNNIAVATVNNDGVVTGIAAGRTIFVFTKTGGCTSPATLPVIVNDCPKAIITGPSAICINGTTTLSPTTGGTWTSSNKAVATVTNAGVVKGIAAGSATFTYTKTGSCNSLATPAVTVSAITPVTITGSNSICINETTTLSPTTGGTWYSSNATVAKVNNEGIVTGIAPGTVTFVFTSAAGCVSPTSATVTVKPNTVVSITGSNTICINGMTTLSPNTGGTWESSNPSIATVNNAGFVTGISSGIATFIFTKTGGCASAPTASVTVNAPSEVNITGSNTICINETTTLSPTSGGTWVSSNTAVATVSNNGIVTGISSGTSTFTFTKTGGCVSAPTAVVTVNTAPAVSITGSNMICINDTTTLSPITGGTWKSNNTDIAILNNEGVVKGISQGSATFTFTSASGCASEATTAVTVNAAASVSIAGSNTICVNETTTLSPTTGGTWSSSNTAIATVNNQGLVTGIASGSVNFIFTSTGGCTSPVTLPVKVNAIPVVSAIKGASAVICVGTTTQLENDTKGGIWSITNETGSASISSSGLIKGEKAGTVKVNYLVESNGCKASAASQVITINSSTVLGPISGPSVISSVDTLISFQNDTPGGIWSIKNGTGMATITSAGIVQVSKRGNAEVVYTVIDNFGVSVSVSKEITILNSCTSTNENSLIVQKLFQNLVRHLYNRICKGDTPTQINGSNPAELMALRPYIKNSLGDKIYNFSYQNTNENGEFSISFSFSPESSSDVLYIGAGATTCPTDINIVKGLENLLKRYSSYNDLLSYTSGGGEQQVLVEVKNIDFCPTSAYTPITGLIVASIEKPTTSDNISFSFEPLEGNIAAKKTKKSLKLSATAKADMSSTLANSVVSYKWIFYELDNVTLTETVTEPLALHRFTVPGNYRLILIVKDQNGFETTFYRDVIVTQTCEPIIGKIKILN